jgi:adenosylhomocysteine nucleosidase
MIAIFHAVAQEVSGLRFRLARAGVEHCGVRLVQTGIGPAAATAAAEGLLQEERPEAAIAAGFAGALDPGLRVGDLVHDAARSTFDLPAGVRCHRGRIVSVPDPVESPSAKAALQRETDALAVDMESEALGEVCRRARVPLLVLRAISDAAADALPIPFAVSWDRAAQRPRTGATLRWLVRHPARLPSVLRFAAGLRCASHRLADGILQCLEAEAMRKLAADPPRHA